MTSSRTTRMEGRRKGDRFWMALNTDDVVDFPSAAQGGMAPSEVSFVPGWLDEVTGKVREIVELAVNARVRTTHPAFDIVRPPILYTVLGTMSVPELEPIQEWEGHVVDIGDEYFTARLLDVTSGSDYPEEEVEILRRELSFDDNHRLSLGSTFRWVIGYEHRNGQKVRISQIALHDSRSARDVDWNQGRRWTDKIRKAIT